MFPTAEDNYGSDACDILHLASSPEALVISTVSGSLMHCVLLPGATDEVYTYIPVPLALHVSFVVLVEKSKLERFEKC